MKRPKRRYNGQTLSKAAMTPTKTKEQADLRMHDAITRLLKDVLVNEPPKDPNPPKPKKPRAKGSTT